MTTAMQALEIIANIAQDFANVAKTEMNEPDKTDLERAEARGRWSAYQAVATHIAKQKAEGLSEPTTEERLADIRQRTEILTRSNKLRENCLKIANLYKETLDVIETSIGQLPPQLRTAANTQMGMTAGFLGVSYATLTGIAIAIQPEEYERADKLIEQIETLCANLKEISTNALNVINKGTLQ